MLSLWIGSFLLEGILYSIPVVWHLRRYISLLIIVVVIISTPGLITHLGLSSVWVLIMILGLYRLMNLTRIIKGRMNEHYLRRAVSRTGVGIFLIHAVLIVFVATPLTFMPAAFWETIALLQIFVAFIVLSVTFKNFTKLKFNMPDVFLTDRELPTVTVAIPARNETTDLQACLNSILANDYPKLEVLVLDDCSQINAADIIKGFAHNGVRFIKGKEPAERWLAKNQAYQKLFEEATGDLILFCGVDVRFGPQSIRSMVNLLASRQKSMLSVLPIRTYSSARSVIIQPLRYWWELALPRRLFNRPAVLSTCWLIGRDDLHRLGGFSAVSHSILPERYFARELVKSDQYSFVRSSAELHVETAKDLSEQYATAVRTRYPSVRRKPEIVLLLTIFHIAFFILPFLMIILSPWWRPVSLLMPLAACIILSATHVIIVKTTDPANTLLASVTFVIAGLVEIFVMYVSMVRYEFGIMEWKDRNICIPVMHVIPKLPPLSDRPSKARPA